MSIREEPEHTDWGKHSVWGGCSDVLLKEELENRWKTPTDTRDWPIYPLASLLTLVSESVTRKSVCAPCKSFPKTDCFYFANYNPPLTYKLIMII